MKKNKKNKSRHDKSAVSSAKVSGPPEMDFSYFSPLEVKVYNNFDRAFKTFRTLVQSEKVLSLFKEKQSYEKPSEKKRRKHNETMKHLADMEIKQKKILSGEYEKEKLKKQIKKEKRLKERAEKIARDNSNG